MSSPFSIITTFVITNRSLQEQCESLDILELKRKHCINTQYLIFEINSGAIQEKSQQSETYNLLDLRDHFKSKKSLKDHQPWKRNTLLIIL